MRKGLCVFALGAILSSCGGGSAADIDVKSIDSACGCAEAVVKIMGAQNDLARDMIALGEDASDEQKQKIEDAMPPLKDKQKEIDKHCRGELSFRKVKDDCAALEELEKLKDEQKELRRKM